MQSFANYLCLPTMVLHCQDDNTVLHTGSQGTVRYSHFKSGEVASRIIKVAGGKLSHLQFGYQTLLSPQDSPHSNVLKL